MLIFWSLVRNSVVLAVYLLFSVACFLTVHEHYLFDFEKGEIKILDCPMNDSEKIYSCFRSGENICYETWDGDDIFRCYLTTMDDLMALETKSLDLSHSLLDSTTWNNKSFTDESYPGVGSSPGFFMFRHPASGCLKTPGCCGRFFHPQNVRFFLLAPIHFGSG